MTGPLHDLPDSECSLSGWAAGMGFAPTPKLLAQLWTVRTEPASGCSHPVRANRRHIGAMARICNAKGHPENAMIAPRGGLAECPEYAMTCGCRHHGPQPCPRRCSQRHSFRSSSRDAADDVTILKSVVAAGVQKNCTTTQRMSSRGAAAVSPLHVH